MRVLVLWAKPSATNLGIQALAAGTEALCRAAFPESEVEFHDHDTPGTPLGKHAILHDVLRHNGEVKRLAREFDLVVDTGSGDSFTDIYGLRRLAVMTYVRKAMASTRTPVVLAPQTIGPFTTRSSRVFARASVRRVARLYTRDTTSTRYSLNVLHRRADYQSADVVFSLPAPESSGRGNALYLNVSGLLWRPNPHVDHVMYRQQVLNLARREAESGHAVVLFAHVLRIPTSREDDVSAVEQAARELHGTAEVFIPNSLQEVREHLAGARAVVGARMHACLNALSVGTPAVAWAYSRKFAPLMADLGWPGVVDLNDDDVVDRTLALLAGSSISDNSLELVRSRAITSLEQVAGDLRRMVIDAK